MSCFYNYPLNKNSTLFFVHLTTLFIKKQSSPYIQSYIKPNILTQTQVYQSNRLIAIEAADVNESPSNFPPSVDTLLFLHCGEGLLESPEPLLTWFALAEATDAGLLRGVICCWGANSFGESEDLGLEPSDDLVCTSPSVISLHGGNKFL